MCLAKILRSVLPTRNTRAATAFRQSAIGIHSLFRCNEKVPTARHISNWFCFWNLISIFRYRQRVFLAWTEHRLSKYYSRYEPMENQSKFAQHDRMSRNDLQIHMIEALIEWSVKIISYSFACFAFIYVFSQQSTHPFSKKDCERVILILTWLIYFAGWRLWSMCEINTNTDIGESFATPFFNSFRQNQSIKWRSQSPW